MNSQEQQFITELAAFLKARGVTITEIFEDLGDPDRYITLSGPGISLDLSDAAEAINKINLPTEEGKRRWPPDGLYENAPCTCKPECHEPCKGRCGCQACHVSYSDYLSSPES